MSTQPVSIEIIDKIDSSIAGKINAIGLAARSAATDVTALQLSLANAAGGTTKLSVALNQVQNPARAASTATSSLERSLANLTSRAVGAELGIGRLGGAFGNLGVAAIGAGPLIAAALAIGAVVGAILIYDKFQAAARAVIVAQNDLAIAQAKNRDTLLDQQETLIGLTQGPLAKYQAELDDLSHKSIKVEGLSELNKLIDAQKSTWDNVVGAIQRYGIASEGIVNFFLPEIELFKSLGTILVAQGVTWGKIADVIKAISPEIDLIAAGYNKLKASADEIPKPFTVQDAQDYINYNEMLRNQSKNTADALDTDLQFTEIKLRSLDTLKQDLLDKGQTVDAANTQKSIDRVKDYYQFLQDALKDNNNKIAIIKAEEANKQQKELFANQLDSLKTDSTGAITPQAKLALQQQQLSVALPDNQDALRKAVATDTQAVDRQNKTLEESTIKMAEAAQAAGAYSIALKEQAADQKIVTDLTEKFKDNTGLDAAIAAQIRLKNTEIESAEELKKEGELYNQVKGPLLAYYAAKEAVIKLQASGEISSARGTALDNAALQTYKDSIDPLNKYNRELQDQSSILAQLGSTSPSVVAAIQSVNEALRDAGKEQLDDTQMAGLKQTLTLMEQQKEVIADVTTFWEANAGAQQKNTAQMLALNLAYKDNVITLGQWKAGALQAELAQNALNNAVTGGTLKSNILQIWGGLIADFKSLQDIGKQVTQNLTQDFTKFFSTLTTGIGNGIAQWAVYGKSLSQALLDTARQAVAGLISSLIQLGIEYLIVIALQKAFGITLPSQKNADTSKQTLTNTVASLAAIAAVTAAELASINILQGPAWDLAEAVSLASFGANAVAATAGIQAVIAAGTAAQAAGAHAKGGFISGPGGIDNIPAWLTAGEFVINAGATARNRAALEAINSGATAVRTNSNSASSSVGGTRLNVSVSHDGSTSIAVQHLSEHEVRIIAKQESRTAVSQYAPQVVASDIHNPNSKVSKALNSNVVAPRKRT